MSSGIEVGSRPAADVTTKQLADEAYEQLVAANGVLGNIAAHLYGDDSPDLDQPIGPGLHGTLHEVRRLSESLSLRLAALYGKL